MKNEIRNEVVSVSKKFKWDETCNTLGYFNNCYTIGDAESELEEMGINTTVEEYNYLETEWLKVRD